MALSSALPSGTAQQPEILFPATTDNNADALIDEALRIAARTLRDTADSMARIYPDANGVEFMRLSAERMDDLLAERA